jgi:alanyl-tRNA synthetase
LELDKQGFDTAMQEQRQRARDARQNDEQVPDLSGVVTKQLSYDHCVEIVKVVVLLKEGKIVEEANEGEEVSIILDVTSFYAESGGQTGDVGRIIGPNGELQVITTKKLPDGTSYHLGTVVEGTIKTAELVNIEVHMPTRLDTSRNHSATHLLHAALKQVVGAHINQSGSSIAADRLRFDFSHFAPVTSEQLLKIEKIINDKILENIPIGIIETTQDIANEMGATALFGEKYGDKVRVVIIDEFSKELCGGTHVERTGEIGLFKLLQETGIGAGLRRIEAVTGHGTQKYMRTLEMHLKQAAKLLKTRSEELVVRLEHTLEQGKEVERELANYKNKLAKLEVEDLLTVKQIICGIDVITGQVTAGDIDDLRAIADLVRDCLVCGVVVLGSVSREKVNFVAMATSAAVAKGIHAGNIIKEVARVSGGSGGGRKEMAQAGGKDPAKITEALQLVEELVENQIN